jgi:hypothetical protein
LSTALLINLRKTLTFYFPFGGLIIKGSLEGLPSFLDLADILLPDLPILAKSNCESASLSYRTREKVTIFPRTGAREKASVSRRTGTSNFSFVPDERESYDFPSYRRERESLVARRTRTRNFSLVPGDRESCDFPSYRRERKIFSSCRYEELLSRTGRERKLRFSLVPAGEKAFLVVPVRGTSLVPVRERNLRFSRAGTRNFSLVPGERESCDFPS